MKNLNYYIMAGLLALALISFGVSHLVQRQMAEGDLRLEIYANGQLYQKISLSETITEEIKVINADGHYNVVEIEKGRARIKEADCPNQVCVKTGWVSQPGQIAVCVPNKFNIAVKGKSNKVDTISY
ncbi:NusG domain II-containing protein [Pelotomaculum isophthalicicum JI]|uniref:NusG domain II-containing protein n=1 Tax=Pelotomaculum isophthalicicum JI TaxID=947010 RepID=A0A9X4H0M7_9FIRM|nr:NusG domain II-containing protein [Pelotomaculum isophthalicicum]MDF9406871.1 NusG domain II-containing protein [Pelotomaculum isophthalicicum JI]